MTLLVFRVLSTVFLTLFFMFSRISMSFQNTNEKTQEWQKVTKSGIEIQFTSEDNQLIPKITRYILEGCQVIEIFFGKTFPQSFIVKIFPNRNSLTEYWRKAWNLPDFEPQCWMVASGAGNELNLLSPTVWKKEACEHDPKDEIKLNRLITHELVHIYHGQMNPHPHFEELNSIGWFIEGLAVYASGQVDDDRLERAREAVKSRKIPKDLKNAWSGPYRYAVCGTLVQYIDISYGRNTVVEMLTATTPEKLLSILKMSEEELIKRWKEFVLKGNKR